MISMDKYEALVEKSYIKHLGRVSKIIGLTIESLGPSVNLGELCTISSPTSGAKVLAEVVGFKENKILLMPLDDLAGIGPGCIVEAIGHELRISVGSRLLGRIVDGLGKPIDELEPVYSKDMYPIEQGAPDPLKRSRITEVLPMGVKAIDGILTIGKGQRVGIFAGSGVGKSTLLGMIARNTHADVNVIALIGERGREVREFIEKDLGEEGLKRSVVVVATSDKPALIRQKAAKTATAIAEYFRDQGKDVMLMMDSLTRFSMAQREIGLAIGEPPVSRGYTPSVFAVMPKLLERAGNSDMGSITALYTVLVDGDDMNEPITDAARGILDGHIVLSRKMANRNHYPAIDILQSISRVMTDIATTEHLALANRLKSSLSVYNDAEDLINIGAYAKGSNPEIDDAIKKYQQIKAFLTQYTHENYDFDEVVDKLGKIFE
ncbi:flagellar-specific ATPase subunit of export apparatus [Petrocella atlantisensis]|uniref:Flagellar-specific ATPase subunit of export apparatus n=1 Tax=Petrocella atlantisensis TaxID=2173034 RepID=A0A3P7NSZ9_9FIRM|nr:flagellar protein export ATPase FliI [Petrocella atlantisensis]MCF8018465.1 flagellar protein export ATPase FliI [Vallitaleaceae bacterium]VDN46324.1 flagellar-specific ATPase subunit of export apparatus [Petrocella atlantisensis]